MLCMSGSSNLVFCWSLRLALRSPWRLFVLLGAILGALGASLVLNDSVASSQLLVARQPGSRSLARPGSCPEIATEFSQAGAGRGRLPSPAGSILGGTISDNGPPLLPDVSCSASFAYFARIVRRNRSSCSLHRLACAATILSSRQSTWRVSSAGGNCRF